MSGKNTIRYFFILFIFIKLVNRDAKIIKFKSENKKKHILVQNPLDSMLNFFFLLPLKPETLFL